MTPTLYAEEYSNVSSTCSMRHPIWLVSEGYGLCYDENYGYYAWKFSPPMDPLDLNWRADYVLSIIDKAKTIAWVNWWPSSKEEALLLIQEDISLIRAISKFDEAYERSRLIPV